MKLFNKNIDMYIVARKWLWIFLIYDFYRRINESSLIFFVLVGLSFCIIFNDYLRNNKIQNEKADVISYCISCLLALGVAILYDGVIYLYLFLISGEAIYYNDKYKRPMIIINFSCFLLPILTRVAIYIFQRNSAYWSVLNVVMLIFFYFSMLELNYYVKLNRDERRKVERLNIQLNKANKQLNEYAEKVEELTLKNERNRMAGEMHDSLGHSLTALIMQLDFAEKIVKKNPDKAVDVLKKSQNVARESLKELRRTVYSLKNEHINNFINSINSIIDNIKLTNNVDIIFKCPENVENLSSQIKVVLYRTIQEGITNSIKHGNANKINIVTHINEKEISLSIGDDGIGCPDEIILNNGLQGIKERAKALNGQAKFYNKKENGFMIEMKIPINKTST